MPIKKISTKDFTLMPWKNGQGLTEQIDLKTQNGKWLWRVSMAYIEKENSFSHFPKYNRLLTVIDGSGFYLNQTFYKQNQIHFFHGEDSIACQPLNGTVKDLGIIFDRDLISVTMDYLKLTDSTIILNNLLTTNYLYCKNGTATVANQQIADGEFLKMEDISIIELSAIKKDSEFFLIKILSCL